MPNPKFDRKNQGTWNHNRWGTKLLGEQDRWDGLRDPKEDPTTQSGQTRHIRWVAKGGSRISNFTGRPRKPTRYPDGGCYFY